MATLIANASGSMTTGTVFGTADTGALATVLIRNTLTTIAAATSATSVTFTVTNGAVIDGVLLWIKATAAAPTGTLKVDLQKGGVSQASVTVNKTDLQDSTSVVWGPTLFKLTSTATGDGGSNWTIVLTTTGTGTLTFNIASATASNFTRALRTTTAANPAAGDDLYVTGELTGAGTHTSRTVTMDSTATTVYGNGAVNSTTVSGGMLAISSYGTLTYGTSASTNYYLKLAGDLRIYQLGTLNIGSSGSEIPRSSTAVLEFQPVSAAGDFGVFAYDNATMNSAGLSRTAGKNIVKAKLTADVASASVSTSSSSTNGSAALTALESTGTSLIGAVFTDTITNATHGTYLSSPSITNTTQTVTIFLAQGSGPTNNRYVRLTVGNNTLQTSVTNGFYSDLDLQAGTAGTVTAVGNGTATSVSIAAAETGWLVKMTGKVSSGLATPVVLVNSCSAPGTTSYAGSATQCFLYDNMALLNAASAPDTTFNIDTDTGWLSGDVVCVASTSRTASQCQIYGLNANAGASSFVSSPYPADMSANGVPAFTHSGTAPTQAEVGLVNRNVKVRSTSASLTTFVYCAALATITFSWAEFYKIGVSNAIKEGIVLDGGATANPKAITFCSIHESLQISIYNSTNAASLNWIISNNIFWNHGVALNIALTASNGDYVIDNNLSIRSSNSAYSLGEVAGTFTNNAAAGFSGWGCIITGGTTIGTFDSNTFHSGLEGFDSSTAGLVGTISNLTVWRILSGNACLYLIGVSPDLIYTNPTVFGGTGANVNVQGGAANIAGGTIAGDTLFASTSAFILNAGSTALNLSNVDTSGTGTGLAPQTNDFIVNASPCLLLGQANNCKFGGSTFLATRTSLSNDSYLSLEKYNQTAGDHRTELKYGQLKTDSAIFNNAAPSMRMTPNSATSKLPSGPKGRGTTAAVASGTAVALSVYVRKSVVGDGAAYNGNQPRLIQRANAALGQSTDLVLATYAAAAGSWNQLSATSSTATDDGAWEFIVDCDGTAGWINIDDWTAY
jgi:hypothetical protein